MTIQTRLLSIPVCIGLLLQAGCGQDGSDPATAQSMQPSTSPAAEAAQKSSAQSAPKSGDDEARRLMAAAEEHLKQGLAKRALQALNQAVEAAPNFADAYVRRADLLAAAELTTQAVSDLTRALELRPHDAKLLNTRGYLRMSQKDLDGALEDFGAAVAADLNYPQPYNNRGLVRITQGDPEKALQEFDSALRIDPDYVDAHNNRGYTLTLLERYDDAVASLSRAIELDAEYVNAWNNRGLAHKAAGNAEEAVADFTRAIELQPTNTKYYLHRSEALAVLDRTDEARADIERAAWLDRLVLVNRLVTTSPEAPSAWLERADHLRRGRRYEPALGDVQRALQLAGPGSPTAAEAYILRARILLEQGDVEQAVEAASAAVRIAPQDQAYSIRGDAYFQLKNYEAALADYRQARRLDPMVKQAYELRAAELEAAGQVQQAGFFREQAAAFTPERLARTAEADASEPAPFPVDVTQPAADAAPSEPQP